ncbi:hypothetical protein HYZ78_00960 [Candidatus Microgenomates bacterium]|nr:hypothetical protein [Candidatus Microgenomates bacterium]
MGFEQDKLIDEKEALQEKCGIAAVYSLQPNADQLEAVVVAASGVQHRGQNGTGLAMRTEDAIFTHTRPGLIRDVFPKEFVREHTQLTRWAMIHCRYGTNGGYDSQNLQPIFIEAEDGTQIAVSHNGEMVAIHELAQTRGLEIPEGASDTTIFTQLLATQEGKDWNEKVVNLVGEIKGSFSLVIGIDDNMYVIRDPMGIRPLFVTQNDSNWLVASETHAFDKVGVNHITPILRGEILKFTPTGPQNWKEGEVGQGNFCDFEWAYVSRPNSRMPENGNDSEKMISFSTFRERCGAILAQEAPVPDATMVIGIPDSGVAAGNGFAAEMGVPYHQFILRDHYDREGDGRTFMTDSDPRNIQKRVVGKLSFVQGQEVWEGVKVVIVDDSIVRANTSTVINNILRSLGVAEIHWRVAFPALSHTCHLGVSMRAEDELIASRLGADEVKIAEEIGATSVNYISHEGFIRARTGKVIIPENPKEIFLANGGCGGCITGIHPVSKEGIIFDSNDLVPAGR